MKAGYTKAGSARIKRKILDTQNLDVRTDTLNTYVSVLTSHVWRVFIRKRKNKTASRKPFLKLQLARQEKKMQNNHRHRSKWNNNIAISMYK